LWADPDDRRHDPPTIAEEEIYDQPMSSSSPTIEPEHDDLHQWLTGLPKIELHCHLEGSMSVATVAALSDRHGVDPTILWKDGLPEAFTFVDFPDFGLQYFYGVSMLRTAEDIATVTDDLAATLAGQNVRYAELTTTAFTYFLDTAGLEVGRPPVSPEEYRDGLDEGRRRAAARGVDIGWVVDIPRDMEGPESTVTTDYVCGPFAPDGLVGLGLGGYEVGNPAGPYRDRFAQARAAGLRSLPHAGETEGSDSVSQALLDLGADRIGHGVRCLEDPEVVELLIERDVMLEVCPTSNLLLGVVDDLAAHPLPELREAGLRVCVNTDDPGWFATDLVTELRIASEVLGVDQETHLGMQLDAVKASYASDAQKATIAAELDTFGSQS